ncbi:MAG: hypothetical protein LBP75_11055 [Planctomycetota bacterium]|jgi:hypothetical protein|nr:hypothetical protein [Planctomycetota bacterium]
MEKLTAQLDALIQRLDRAENFHSELARLQSIYPFSRYEYILSTLLARGKLNFDEYLQIRDAYIDRNLFLYIFEITAPRGFGDTWAFGHLREVEPTLKKPNKKRDPNYGGEYDLYLDDDDYIKIEVKASRATDRELSDEPLYVKALSVDSQRPFLMNFQQLKPKCCDIFLWIAVYRDAIKYWIIGAATVQTHPDFSPQHRNETTAQRGETYHKEDIYEGQIMVTDKNIHVFDRYLVTSKGLIHAIKEQYQQTKQVK